MLPSRTQHEAPSQPDGLGAPLSLGVVGASTVYALTLGYLERRFPIKPDHIWAEVAGGVMISLVPVALAARKSPQLDWRSYESAVWCSFMACGTPIILWQIGEAVLRQYELLCYKAARELNGPEAYADTTPPLALRSRAGA